MANISGIGTDLVYIPRIEKLYQKFGIRFVHRILHPAERAQMQQVYQPSAFLAKRFAAKEALAKALGTGIAKGVRFHDFIIAKNHLGQPRVQLEGMAEKIALKQGVKHWHLSISDEKEYAMAFVVAEIAVV